MAILKQCPNGHYYDPDVHSVCPYCAPSDYVDRVYNNPDYSYTDFIERKEKRDDMNSGVSPFDEPLRDSCDPEYVTAAEIEWQLFTQSMEPVQKAAAEVSTRTTQIKGSEEDTLVFINLWNETADGPMGGVGEYAVFFPNKGIVEIRGWGPDGERKKEIHVPPSITTREDVLRYLKDDYMFAGVALRRYEEEKNDASESSVGAFRDQNKKPDSPNMAQKSNKRLYPVNAEPIISTAEKQAETKTNSNDRELLELFTDIGKATADPVAFRKRMTELQAAKNRHLQENCNDPDYGLVAEKPIFVKGFGMDQEYLNHLYTPDGKKLSCSRTGSRHVAGIAGPVDQYIMYLPNKSEYKRIFISVYGSTTSTKAPRGIIYR